MKTDQRSICIGYFVAAHRGPSGRPWARAWLLFGLGLLFALTARADLLEQGFRIEYQVSRNGLTLGMTERALQHRGDGQFEFRSKTAAEGLVAVLFSDVVEEHSRLRIEGGHARPQSYSYRRTGGKKDRSYALRFDWPQAQLEFGSNQTRAPLAPQTQDALSFFTEVMLRLQAGDSRFDMAVAGRKRVRSYQVSTVGSETLKTAIGTLALIHLRAQEVGRDTRYELWCSAAHDYLPLKILQIKPDETIKLMVRGLQAG